MERESERARAGRLGDIEAKLRRSVSASPYKNVSHLSEHSWRKGKKNKNGEKGRKASVPSRFRELRPEPLGNPQALLDSTSSWTSSGFILEDRVRDRRKRRREEDREIEACVAVPRSDSKERRLSSLRVNRRNADKDKRSEFPSVDRREEGSERGREGRKEADG